MRLLAQPAYIVVLLDDRSRLLARHGLTVVFIAVTLLYGFPLADGCLELTCVMTIGPGIVTFIERFGDDIGMLIV